MLVHSESGTEDQKEVAERDRLQHTYISRAT